MNNTASPRRVLCVDDCPVALTAVASYLEADYEVFLAQDCDTAFELGSANKPDAIVLDMELEQGTGLDLLQMLNQDPNLTNLPVVIVSACASRYILQLMHHKNITGFLNKPVTAKELKASIRAATEVGFIQQFTSTPISTG